MSRYDFIDIIGNIMILAIVLFFITAVWLSIILGLRKLFLWYWQVNQFFTTFEESLVERRALRKKMHENNEIQNRILGQFEILNNQLLEEIELEEAKQNQNVDLTK